MKLISCYKLKKFIVCKVDVKFDTCPLPSNKKRVCKECNYNALKNENNSQTIIKVQSFIDILHNEEKRININGLIDYFEIYEILKIFKINSYSCNLQKMFLYSKWSKLSSIGNIKILQSAYIFLVVIPIFNSLHFSNIYNQLSYLAALVISISHAGFNYYCPFLFKEYKNQTQFVFKMNAAKFILGSNDSCSTVQFWSIADIVHPIIRISLLIGYVVGFLLLLFVQIHNVYKVLLHSFIQ